MTNLGRASTGGWRQGFALSSHFPRPLKGTLHVVLEAGGGEAEAERYDAYGLSIAGGGHGWGRSSFALIHNTIKCISGHTTCNVT